MSSSSGSSDSLRIGPAAAAPVRTSRTAARPRTSRSQASQAARRDATRAGPDEDPAEPPAGAPEEAAA